LLLGIRWGSLRTKIIAWSFVPTAMILSVVALIAFYSYQRVTADLVMAKNQELARLSAGQIAGEMTEYTGDLATVARTLSSYANSPVALAATLHKAANRVVVFDGGVVVLNNHGKVVAAVGPERPEILGQDWSSRAYVREILRSKGPVFSGIVTDGPGGAPVMVVAVPITSDRGEFLGTAAGMFRLGEATASSFYGSIVKLRIAPSDTAFVVDGEGRVLYHADAARSGEDFSGQGAVREVMDGQVGALRTYNVGGQEIVASYAPVPGTPWGLVIEADWRGLLQPSRGYSRFLLVLLGLGVLIPAVVVAIGSRRITKPIDDLIDAAKGVASGNFGQTVSASTGDEVGQLVTQFNLMSVELESSYAALSGRNEQLELIMRSSNDGIWDWDLRTNRSYFSPRWKGILGYADEEIADEFDSWRGLLHPDDVQPSLAALQAYLDGKSPQYAPEFRLRHKDGSYRWILARGVALRDEDGKPYRMVGSHTDITEQKRVQEILAGQRHFLELLATGESFCQTLDALVRSIEEQSPGIMGLVRLVEDAREEEDGTNAGAEQGGRRLRCAAAPSLPQEYLQALDAQGNACGAAALAGQRVIIEDIATDARWDGVRDLPLRYGLRGCWAEPILSPVGRVAGIFAVFSLQPRAPTEAELRTMETAARLVGIALEHQQAQEAVQSAYQSLERRVGERTRELATLNAIATVVSRSLNLEAILGDALDKTMEVMGMDMGVAYRLEGGGRPDDASFQDVAERQVLNLMVHRGLSDEVARQVARVPLAGPEVMEQVAAAGGALVWRTTDYLNPRFREILSTAEARISEEDVRQTVSVPLMAKGRMVGCIFLIAREERSVGAEELALLASIGQQVGVAVENAYLYKAEQEGRAEAERRRQVAEGLRETLRVLNSRQSLSETLEHIVAQASQLLGSDAVALLRLQDKEGPLVIQAAYGLAADYVADFRMPLGKSASGRAVVQRAPVTVPDMLELLAALDRDPSLEPEFDRALAERVARLYRALLAVPLIVKDEAYGAINLYYREPREFTEEETRLALSVANQAALAIESDRLREQAQQAAAVAERTRLARELHDSVTQSLYSVTLYAEAAARLLVSGQQTPAAEYLREVRDTAQEALREMRLLIFELRPPTLEDVGLVGALQARLQAVEERGGMRVELRVEGAPDAEHLPLAVQAELYYIIQEALNNALKHAHAQQVWVDLRFDDASVYAGVRDDGIGFDPVQSEAGGGLGIEGMRERAERIGARFEIESRPGEGATVRVKKRRL
jgi:PAS domain S-box-containing protein